MAATRNQQPSYDFLTGGDQSAQPASKIPTSRRTSVSRPPSGVPVRASIDNEALRAQINTLRYELDTARQTRALEVESQATEVRELERRAETESRRAEAATREADGAKARLDALSRDGREREVKAENERAELERRVRSLAEKNGELGEEVADFKAELAGREREALRRYAELEQRYEALGAQVEDVRSEAEGKNKAAIKAQERLVEREARVGELETEVLQLKAQAGDKDTLEVIKRELAGQVGHIRTLEKTVAEQAAELKRLRRERKAVEVAEEEKRALEAKLGLLDELRRECSEAQLQKRILEDEKRSWTSYLESQSTREGELVFTSPEDMARALVQERLERLSLVEQLGKITPEVTVRDDAIAALEQDKARLEGELKKAKSAPAAALTGAETSKAQARLERQRQLAVKEVEYLRAQLKSLEDETTEFDPSKADASASSRTTELEALIDSYKSELASLHAQLSAAESSTPAPAASLKRPAEDAPTEESSHALSDLRRKLRAAQIALSESQKTSATLSADLAAARTQVSGLQTSAATRALELRSNPTATHQAIAASTLRTLRAENAVLRSKAAPKTLLAKEVHAAAQLEIEDLTLALKQADKKAARMKSIWAAKAGEFTEAISSTLGWQVAFLPHGKTKLTSRYYPSAWDEETGSEEENFILFDGEAGTMKISGGEKSRFAREIREMVEFWVEGKGEVPLFLAACQLEFGERAKALQT